MLALILFLILLYVAAGIVGFVIKGLLWLFVVACVLFAVTLVVGGVRAGRRSARRT
jgi:membrane protein implicated in regulation of membrane protease activity